MPFVNQKQRAACYAEKARNPKSTWDCDKWNKETPKNIPKGKMGGKSKWRGQPCMECGGEFQGGGPLKVGPDGFTILHDNRNIDPGFGMKDPWNGRDLDPGFSNPRYATGVSTSPKRDFQAEIAAKAVAPVADHIEVTPYQGKEKSDFDWQSLFGYITGAVGELAGKADRSRQNQYMYNQYSTLGQMNPIPAENYQPNPYSLYAKYGGSLKKYQTGGPIVVNNPNDKRLRAYNDSMSLYTATKGDINRLKTMSQDEWFDYTSQFYKNKKGIAAGKGFADLEKINGVAPRPISSFGAQTGVGSNRTRDDFAQEYKKPVQPVIYRKPELILPQRTNGVPIDETGAPIVGGVPGLGNVNIDNLPTAYTAEVGDLDNRTVKYFKNLGDWQKFTDENPYYSRSTTGNGTQAQATMKKEGGGIKINPAHKGWCTPMSKPTCTGKRRAFAQMMKKHHGFPKK